MSALRKLWVGVLAVEVARERKGKEGSQIGGLEALISGVDVSGKRESELAVRKVIRGLRGVV